MISLIVDISKYINIILIALYTFLAFRAIGTSDINKNNSIIRILRMILFTIHFNCYFVLYLNSRNLKVLFLYFAQVLVLVFAILIYQWIYHNLSKLILHNMLFLLSIGFIILTRLSFDKALKQFGIASATLAISFILPFIIDKLRFLSKLGWLYGAIGILLLLTVLFWGTENYGATNWINIKGITFQPSEFVKIIFIFCVGSLFARSTDFRQIAFVTITAAAHVLILVLEKDLGGALIFFVTYLVMLYVATSKPLYFFSGLAAGCVASYVAYNRFYHVKVRVMAWRDPWLLIDNEGYQVSQSLFAIGTGGWFGLGLSKGLPNSIPVVDSDFIFSAISEEMGGIFALCLILIYISCFITFINIAMRLKNKFYKIITLGFSVLFIFQVFLSIGGVTKFIPSTGVTLPFISYGGSSILSSIIMFSIIQGLYILNQDRNEISEKRKNKTKKATE